MNYVLNAKFLLKNSNIVNMQNQSWRLSKDEASSGLVFGKSRLNRQLQFKETQNSKRILKQQTADISRI